MGSLGNGYLRQCPLLSEKNLIGSPEVYFRALLSALSFLVIFINGLAEAIDSMWIRFVEDRKLGGIANVLDEGVGTKQTPTGWDHGPILT